MSDSKSKLPDLKELGSMAGKLFKDLKTSVSEIIEDYQKTREQTPPEKKPAQKPTTAAKTKPTIDDKPATPNSKQKASADKKKTSTKANAKVTPKKNTTKSTAEKKDTGKKDS